MFDIDFKRLILQLLPTFYRQPLIFGLLRAALIPLEYIYQQFCNVRYAHNYKLQHNGQVCYLRAVLNDAFQSSYGKFDILTIQKEGEWLYAITEIGTKLTVSTSEDETVNGKYVDNGQVVPVVYSEFSLNKAQNNFIVSVPFDLYSDQMLIAIASLVDKYKLISKRAIYMANTF